MHAKTNPLTPRQQQALARLVAGATITECALSTGVDRRTIQRWLHPGHVFQAHYAQLQAEHYDALQQELRQLGRAAVDSLHHLLTDSASSTPTTRFRAAQYVLDSLHQPAPAPEITLPNDDFDEQPAPLESTPSPQNVALCRALPQSEPIPPEPKKEENPDDKLSQLRSMLDECQCGSGQPAILCLCSLQYETDLAHAQNGEQQNEPTARFAPAPEVDEAPELVESRAVHLGLQVADSVLPQEDHDEFAQVQLGFYHHYAPANAVDQDLVRQLTTAAWQLRRLDRVLNPLLIKAAGPAQTGGRTRTEASFELANAFQSLTKEQTQTLRTLRQERQHIERTYQWTLTHLERRHGARLRRELPTNLLIASGLADIPRPHAPTPQPYLPPTLTGPHLKRIA